MGPQHPSTHGVLRIVLKLNGEQVVDLDPVLGYLHRGVEKICENGDYHHVVSQLDPLEYISSLFWNGRTSWPARSCSTSRCRAAPSTSASCRASSTGSRATRCSWAGSRSTSAA